MWDGMTAFIEISMVLTLLLLDRKVQDHPLIRVLLSVVVGCSRTLAEG